MWGMRVQSDYERIASFFGILSDWKDGVPRASYRGVVRPPATSEMSRPCKAWAGSFCYPVHVQLWRSLLSVPWLS